MASDSEILVTIPQGTLKGKEEKSPYGDVYYSFQGIPYARPPVGDLRFEEPQPADGWDGIRDATKTGAEAISPSMDIFETGILKILKDSSEDCLFINVFTREIPKPGKKCPVMVNIHGGGYTMGSGNKSFNSPDYLMVHDVVYVSFNYRLGALGFLSLQTLECPGNYGLKDQRLALRWIQNNISYFGGDPDNVTIFGISAGGSSVHNLTLSPSCKGLFKKAIALSGSSTSAWGLSLHPRECAYLLGKKLGCDAKNNKELLDFLKKASAEDIISKSAGIWAEVEGARVGEKMLNFSFTPTAETEYEDAILPGEPVTKGNQLDIPFITGVTNRELLMEISNSKSLPKWTEDKDFQELIPRELNVPKDSELSLKIAKKIREFFFKNKDVNLEGLVDALSDIHFNHGAHRAIKHRLTNPKLKSPTFAYIFSYDTALWKELAAKVYINAEPNEIKGIAHGGDILYYFVMDAPPLVSPPLEPGTADYKLSQQLVKMWVDFATTGRPTNENSEIKWLPTTAENDVYLSIDAEIQMKNGYLKERMEFWDEIFRLAGREPYANN